MTGTERLSPKYKDTVSDMNREYSKLLRAVKLRDCRVEYLTTFEKTLDLNLPFSLWTDPSYVRMRAKYRMPRYGYISYDKFDAYMMLYSFLMRKAGLLNRSTDEYDDSAEMDLVIP